MGLQRLDRFALGVPDHHGALRLAGELLVERGREARLADDVVGVELAVGLLDLLGRRGPHRAEQRPREVARRGERRLAPGELDARNGAQLGLDRGEVLLAKRDGRNDGVVLRFLDRLRQRFGIDLGHCRDRVDRRRDVVHLGGQDAHVDNGAERDKLLAVRSRIGARAAKASTVPSRWPSSRRAGWIARLDQSMSHSSSAWVSVIASLVYSNIAELGHVPVIRTFAVASEPLSETSVTSASSVAPSRPSMFAWIDVCDQRLVAVGESGGGLGVAGLERRRGSRRRRVAALGPPSERTTMTTMTTRTADKRADRHRGSIAQAEAVPGACLGLPCSMI